MTDYDISEKYIGGQNLITGTHNGSAYAGGESYVKDGSISGQVYKFKSEYVIQKTIETHGTYTLSFLLYIEPKETDIFNQHTLKAKFASNISTENEITAELSTVFNTSNPNFKFVKFTLNTEDSGLELPITVSLYTTDKSEFIISDLKLEFGRVATAWSKSIDDAVVDIPANLLDKAQLGSLIIPITGWVSYTEDPTGYYKKFVDVPLEGVTTQHVLNGTIAFNDQLAAAKCGLAAKSDTLAGGYVRFFAKTVPEKELHVDYVLMKGKYLRDYNGVITIPIEGWIDADDPYYKKKLVMTAYGTTPNDYFMGGASFETNDIAVDCELGSIDSGDGTITFMAKKVPSAPIDYEYTIIEGGE